jgi:hypothetical protein
MDLPNVEDLYNSAVAPAAAPPDLPKADDLYDQATREAHESELYPTVGRIVSNYAEGVKDSYLKNAAGQSEEAVNSPVSYNAKLIGEQFIQGSKQLSAAIMAPFVPDQLQKDMEESGDLGATPVKDRLIAQAKAEGRDLTTDEMKQIGAEAGAGPLNPFIQVAFSPLAPLMPLLEGANYAAEKEGIAKGNIALANTALLAMGLARVPHEVAIEGLAAGAHLPEDTFMGLKDATDAEAKVSEIATNLLPAEKSDAEQISDLQEKIKSDPQKAEIYQAQIDKITEAEAPQETPEEVPNVHYLASQIAPKAIAESRRAEAQQQVLREGIENLKAERQKTAEENTPHDEEIAALQESMAGKSKRQKKIVQQKIDDLTQKNQDWIEEQTTGDTPEMQALREGIQSLHEVRANNAAEVSEAYRRAQEQMPKEPEVAEEPASDKVSSPEEYTVNDPIGSDKPIKVRIIRRADSVTAFPEDSGPIEIKPMLDAGFTEEQALGQALAESGKEGGTVSKISDEPEAPSGRTPEEQHAAIVEDIVKNATKVGYGEEEARASAEIIARQYRYLSEAYGGKKGSTEELYAKEKPRIIGQGEKIGKSKELVQNKSLTEETQAAVNKMKRDSLMDQLKQKGMSSKDIADFMRRAEETGIKDQERGRYSKDIISLADWIRDEKTGETLNQGATGKYHILDDGRRLLRLMKSANPSTLIHEGAHHFLDMMKRFELEDEAPDRLKVDMQEIRDWVGIKDKEEWQYLSDAPKGSKDYLRYKKAEEKFARGFEAYVMEGHAPTKAMIPIFEKFAKWLTDIYKTVKEIPDQQGGITPSIRDFFDRIIEPNAGLRDNPRNAIVAPEYGASQMLADIHEADAKLATKSTASSVADNIEHELDKTLILHNPEIYDEVKAAESGQAPSVPAPAADAPADIAAEPEPAGGQRDTQPAGGGGSSGEGARERPANAVNRASTEPPESAHAKFDTDTKFIDRAGNIRLDNLSTPEDVNQVIRDAAQENGDFLEARRGVMSDGDVLTLAESLGMDPAMLNRRKIGQAFNAEQIRAARKLLVQSATHVRDLMDKAADGTDQDVINYAEARARHQMIQEQVAGITAEAGRALRAFQKMEGFTEAQALGEFLKAQTGKDLFQLKQEAQLGKTLDSAEKVSKFVNDSKKQTVRNMILEYYINSLISGPITHLRYSVGNALNALWTPLVETPVAAAIGAFRGEGERVYLGEAGAQLHGLLKGSKDGMYAAATAFKTGVSPLLPGEKVSPLLMDRTNAIPGKIGKVINIPSKSVAAIHSFFKSIRYEQNIQALAYRAAMSEGLKGDAFVNRVSDLTVSPSESMMENATASALKELYMSPTDYHSAMGALTRFTNQSLLAKIIVPFMKIGSQITRNAFVERTPLGLGSSKIRTTLSEGGAGRDFQLAKMAAGVALMGTTALLAAEGKATGDGPNDPQKRAVWLLSHSPNSIQIGSITVPYQGLGHLGMLMRFSANMYETASEWGKEDDGKLALSFLEGVNKSVLDENFMRGLKDMLDAVYHSEEYGNNYLKNFATNWLPFSVGLGQVARKIDPYHRETRDILDAAWAKIPVVSEGLFPHRDMFGNPIPNGGPIQSYLNDPVVQRMNSLQIGVGRVEKKINGVELTPQQYDDYARISGKLAKTMLNNIVTPNFAALPQGQQIKIIKETIDHARETARNMVKFNPANQNILRQMIANKQALFK